MCSIGPPQSQRRIASFTEALIDLMISGEEPYGPFESEKYFNNFRISRFELYPYCKVPSVRENLTAIHRAMPDDHDIVFTHGDISFRIMIVDIEGDGDDEVHIVALVDWAQAGWRPGYWEKVKMLYVAIPASDWAEAVQSWIVEGYEKGIEHEIQLRLIHGGGIM